MSDGEKTIDDRFQYLDDMSTELLENLVRTDLDKESDPEMMMYVLQILEKRKNGDTPYVDVEQSWQSFQNEYLPMAGEAPLFPDVDDDGEKISASSPATKQKSKRVWSRVAGIAAAIVLLVAGSMVTAYACGFDVLSVVAHWTKDTFGFSVTTIGEPVQEMPSSQESADLAETLLDYGIEEPLVPTWFPEGFILDGVNVMDSPVETIFIAEYSGENSEIVVQVRSMSQDCTSTFEKDDTGIEIFPSHGVDYFISQNNGLFRATWFVNTYECSVTGCESEETLKHMIKSIGEDLL